MALGLFDYELKKFSSTESVDAILSGKDSDCFVKEVFKSKDDNSYHFFLKSISGLFLEPSRPEYYYLLIYKQGSPGYMAIDIDYKKTQHQIFKLTESQFKWKRFCYGLNSEYTKP